jgi:hypothetical protein
MIVLQVRGILNKLTPEKFEKLNNDILNIGLESTTILKGVILLVFIHLPSHGNEALFHTFFHF